MPEESITEVYPITAELLITRNDSGYWSCIVMVGNVTMFHTCGYKSIDECRDAAIRAMSGTGIKFV